MHSYLFLYEGPVLEFDNCIERHWITSTYAVSEKKALNNLSYRYKKEHGKTANSKIKLPGKLTAVAYKEGDE